MYYACLLYVAQETETKFYLLRGGWVGGGGERVREESAANLQNKIVAKGYIPPTIRQIPLATYLLPTKFLL